MSSYGGKWAQLMAGACIVTIPIIELFFFAQKTFVQGLYYGLKELGFKWPPKRDSAKTVPHALARGTVRFFQ